MRNRSLNLFLFFFILTLLFFRQELLSLNSYFARDLFYLFHPWKEFTTEQLQAGHFPLWNPYNLGGIPLLGNFQTAILYPLSLPFYFFPFPWALKCFHSLHYTLAGFGAFLLLKQQRYSILASLTAALIWMLGGFLICQIEFLSRLGSFSWLPWVLLASTHSFLLIFISAFVFSAGYPQVFLFNFIILGFMLHFLLRTYKASIRTVVVWGLGGLLTGPQLTLGVEFIVHSQRFQEGLGLSVAGANSLVWRDLLGLINPFWAATHTGIFSGERFYWATTSYMGIAGAFLCCIGLMSSSYRRHYLAASILILLCALGTTTPIYPWLLHHIILLRSVRYPGNYLYLMMPMILILVAQGVDFWRRLKIKGLLLISIIFELSIYGFHFQPVLPHSFFRERGPLTTFLQTHLSPGMRFFLSPLADADREGVGSTTYESWVHLRERLFNLTGLPYHLPNLDGIGEPLVTKDMDTYLNLIRSQNPNTVAPYLTTMAVQYLLTANQLPFTGLMYYSPALWHVYKNPDARSPWLFVHSKSADLLHMSNFVSIEAINHSMANSPYHYWDLTTLSSGWYMFSQNHYPGWELWDLTRQHRIASMQSFFPFSIFELHEQHYRLIWRYRPISLLWGLLMSLGTLGAIFLYSIIRIRTQYS